MAIVEYSLTFHHYYPSFPAINHQQNLIFYYYFFIFYVHVIKMFIYLFFMFVEYTWPQGVSFINQSAVRNVDNGNTSSVQLRRCPVGQKRESAQGFWASRTPNGQMGVPAYVKAPLFCSPSAGHLSMSRRERRRHGNTLARARQKTVRVATTPYSPALRIYVLIYTLTPPLRSTRVRISPEHALFLPASFRPMTLSESRAPQDDPDNIADGRFFFSLYFYQRNKRIKFSVE